MMSAQNEAEFEQLPLYAHRFLAGVPIHSIDRLELPGGRSGMTILEIKEKAGFKTAKLEAGRVTRFLFWLRGEIGKLFGWDDAPELVSSVSYLSRIDEDQRKRSLVTPGEREGISRVLYCFEHEFLAEIINKTVHCFWLMTATPTPSGYVLYTTVYVQRLNWFTPVYMTLVGPILKWIVYPALQKSMLAQWESSETSNGQESMAAAS